MRLTTSTEMCANFNALKPLIRDLNYIRLEHLLKINDISHRTLLIPYLVSKGIVSKIGKIYSVVDSSDLPHSFFTDFLNYARKYQEKHKSKYNDKMKSALDKQSEITGFTTIPLSEPEKKEKITSEQKIKVLREVFKKDVSDEATGIILNSLHIKL